MATIVKDFTFSAGATIIASEHNANLNTIYDDYNGNITNANIASGAAIANSKLNLSSISQNITFTGNNTFAGTTIANLGTVTTADINGGTIDATNIGVTTPGSGDFTTLQFDSSNQGDIYYDNGTDGLVRLTPGTSGQFLKTQGAAANPTWDDVTDPAISIAQASGTFSSATSSNITQTVSEGDVFKFVWEGTVSANNFSTPNIRINADGSGSDYEILLNSLNRTAASTATNTAVALQNQADCAILDESTNNSFPYSTYGSFYLEVIITARGSDTLISWELSCSSAGTAANSHVKTSGVSTYKAGTPTTSVGLYRGSGTATMSGRYYVQQLSQS